ncbi:MAG: pyruvate kinase [Gammaproteobacteria bacterium]|nr:pyruvate kinase [Gammaproteobacteria bacterium]
MPNVSVGSQWRKTKIIATLGPGSNSRQIIREMIEAGVNVFRLNMSHGNHQSHASSVELIKSESEKLDVIVAILVDLSGPKIRVGLFHGGEALLEPGKDVIITCEKYKGDQTRFCSQYEGLYVDVKSGDRIFIDDGKIGLIVDKIERKDIYCKVKNGGIVRDNKGMNLPDTIVSIDCFTDKDMKDADFAISINADFVALSFVGKESDVIKLKKYLEDKSSNIKVIAKIERSEAVDNIHSIIEEAYGIMIARGDLGIELPAQEVPIVQKNLIEIARKASKPVIVATQMLESMIKSSTPTRAEVGDVANAALSGVDAVMLSAETASGKYPVKSVQMMSDILKEIDIYHIKRKHYFDEVSEREKEKAYSIREAVSHAVTSLAKNLDLKGIIVPTRTGTTAVVLAANRPLSSLIAVCDDDNICRRMSLHWGVLSFKTSRDMVKSWKDLCLKVSERCLIVAKGDSVLLVSGFNDDPQLNEPVIKLVTI